ncbi:MAG: Glu-tRNA(Gln) amidotransferase subunit GatE [Candidatus Marsarchaeota archaeon]|nr:Glu-tRNA(Gln) amidotransferase subunit GatE [Candidatus Marsarchaeota archaeon]
MIERKSKPTVEKNATKGQGEDSHYAELGFMCGLEIHQRLATSKKLFCDCPASIAEEDPLIGKIDRYQRAVAGELGNVDRSAEFEEFRNRKFVYDIHVNHSCLVDIDEEPPHRLNEEALGIALSLSKAMKMNIIEELQPMRKEVVDGSDPSAFQRTIFVAADGEITVNDRKIGMPSLFLEEESSGIVTATEDSSNYDISRLGIPLIEIDTSPYIPSPKAAKEIALYIGTLLRISGKVQRGIGSIRQDVNVSIKRGNRVEIKGLQEVDKIDKFIENEVVRQQKLIEIVDELSKMGAKVEDNVVDVTNIFTGSNVRVISTHLEKNGKVLAFALRNFKGFLGKEINPNRRLGTEISDYAKMAKVKGLIHSDENLAGYGFTEKDLGKLKEALDLGENDAFILIAGSENDVKRAAILAVDRAKYALVGVPLETRGVSNVELCTTKFQRPLPGGSRMYPETDAKPIPITNEMLAMAEKSAPNIEKERKRLSELVSNSDLCDTLLVSQRLNLFKNIVSKTKADPNFVANTIIQKFTELKRNGFNIDLIDERRLTDLFEEYGKGKITKQAVDELLKNMTLNKTGTSELITINRLHRITGIELRDLIDRIRKESNTSSPDELRTVVMSKYRLNVDGSELNSLLK